MNHSSTPSIRPVEDLAQRLTAFPELGMRVGWLEERLRTLDEELVRDLDSLVLRSFSGESRARSGTLALALVILRNDSTPLGALLADSTPRAYAPHLERMVRRVAFDGREIELDIPVPPYVKNRELTVGERRSLARRPNRLHFDKLLLDPNPLVLAQLFDNPALSEDEVLRLTTRRPARLFAIRELIKRVRWMSRRRVRLALVQNPGIPPTLALPLLATLPREDLVSVTNNTTLHAAVITAALEVIERLPPHSDESEPVWQ